MKTKRNSIKHWWRHLRRSSQVLLVLLFITGTVSVVAVAAGILFGTANGRTALTKERYIEVKLDGVNATGDIRPGTTVSLAPVLTNNGDVAVTAFIELSIPTYTLDTLDLEDPHSEKAAAYDYEVGAGWTEVDRYMDGKQIVVYGYVDKTLGR